MKHLDALFPADTPQSRHSAWGEAVSRRDTVMEIEVRVQGGNLLRCVAESGQPTGNPESSQVAHQGENRVATATAGGGEGQMKASHGRG